MAYCAPSRKTTTRSSPVVSIGQLKEHLRIRPGNQQHDTELERLLAEATESVEAEANITLGQTVETAVWPRFPRGTVLEVPRGPLLTTTAPVLTYWDTDETEQTMDPADYFVDDLRQPGGLWIRDSWPQTMRRHPEAVKLVYHSGFAADEIPQIGIDAVLMLAGHRFENPEYVILGATVATIPDSLRALINRLKIGDWP